MSHAYPDPLRRLLITAPTALASILVTVDITIANVALPHMQATMSASQEQIVWVLTSYLVAGAIGTPLSGWLAGRFGRKMVMVASVGSFTVASLLCGMANDLETLVFARFLQGLTGAALMPLSQATLLDINPPERHARAMALFGISTLVGPFIGPTLGGWLTDTLSWRWVFFINLPFGILALIGLMAFMYESRDEKPARFDLFGFAMLSIFLASLQLLLDRGEHLDWFDSTEVRIYAVTAALSLYLTVVHIFTVPHPFIKPQLFKDRNFFVGSLINITLGIVAFATVPLIVVMMQNQLGYTAFHTGMIGVPRAVGTMIAMLIVSRLMGRFDGRTFVFAGLVITAVSMLLYSHIDLYVDERFLMIAGLVQGTGAGLIMVPLSVVVFTTLPVSMRNEGASMFALTRNIGQSVGISLLQRELIHYTAGSRAHLVQGVRPDSPILQYAMPDFDFGSTTSVAQLYREVVRQAGMVGYVDVFQLICVLAVVMLPLVFLMRTSQRKAESQPLPVME